MRYFWFFFGPKSNPYMPLVNFRKKIRIVSFDFRQNFEVRTFTRWLSIRGTKFFLRDIKIFFFQNLHCGPIRWVPWRFFQILIFFLKVWWPDATLFYFISFSFIYTIHSHILTFINIRRGSPPFLHRWKAQWQTPPWGAESGFELGPAVQRADMLPTEPCRTLNFDFL
jgi:hypothetical protein